MENKTYSDIDSLPTNPMNSNNLSSENSMPMSEPTMNQSLEFPEEFSQTPQNLVIDKQSIQSNPEVTSAPTVKFDEEKHVFEYNPIDMPKSSSSPIAGLRDKIDEPIIYIAIICGLVYFLMENPIIKNRIISFVSGYIVISGVDGSLNILGKVFMSVLFASIVFSLYRFIDVSSFNIVLY